MRKKHSRNAYQEWVRIIQSIIIFGGKRRWVLWGCLAILLIGNFWYSDLRTRNFPTFLQSLSAPNLPSHFLLIAKTDIPTFTILTQRLIDVRLVQQGIGGAEQTRLLSQQIEMQRRNVYSHITLKPYMRGEEIQPVDLGPQIADGHMYVVRELMVASYMEWLHVGDRVDLLLDSSSMCGVVGNISSQGEQGCSSQEKTSRGAPVELKKSIVLRTARAKPDGLIAALVAIPREENESTLSLLERATNGTIIAYPMVFLQS